MSNLIEEKVPLKSRIWVSAADGSVAVLQAMIGGGALTYYFTRIRGLDPGFAAIVWILFGVWNAINDPLFGFISDGTKSPLGRRIPYIRYGAPFFALFYILCWVNWSAVENNQWAMFFQLLVFLFFFDILYTAVATSLYIMPFEMAISNRARGTIFVWKIIFSAFAIVIPLIVIPIIQPGPGDDLTNYFLFHVTFAIFGGVIIYVSTYFYNEKHYLQEEKQPPFLEALKQTFKNYAFIIFEVISFTIIYVQTGLMQGVLYYFDEFGLSMVGIFGAMILGVIAAIYLFVLHIEQWGVKKCMQAMLGAFSLGCFIILIFGRYLIPTMFGFFGIGLGILGGYYLIPMMNGDVIDKDEETTGLRREGMYAGVNSFITKPAISIAQAVFLLVIDYFGYDQSLPKGEQSAEAENGILLAWVLIPGILLAICFLVMKWYPLSGENWTATKKALAEKHQQKEKEYLEKMGFKAE